MFAVLGFWDFFLIALIVIIFAGGSAAFSFSRPTDAARIRRIEAKLDLILKELKLDYIDLSAEVRALADDPAKKIAAIKLLREQTGLSLKEAKDAVEAYVAGRGM